jgi:hypothetical protein
MQPGKDGMIAIAQNNQSRRNRVVTGRKNAGMLS